MTDPNITSAAHLIATADALFIGAGAGMSVDSGLVPYRGAGGRYTTTDIHEASGQFFEDQPEQAAHAAHARHRELLTAVPHDGYAILRRWAAGTRYGAGVFTTNVDTMFVRAKFDADALYEAHGSVTYSQCAARCGAGVFPTDASGPTRCSRCEGWARPNTLLFGDFSFDDSRRWTQWENLSKWFATVPEQARVVVVEIGAGTEVPIVRNKCRALAASEGWPLIRINPSQAGLDDAHPDGSVSVPLGALEALQKVDREVQQPDVGARTVHARA